VGEGLDLALLLRGCAHEGARWRVACAGSRVTDVAFRRGCSRGAPLTWAYRAARANRERMGMISRYECGSTAQL
jgi:hypothetical protein